MPENVEYHKWLKDDTIKVKLERGQKGTYAWELTCEGEDVDKVLARLKEADDLLREQYSSITLATSGAKEESNG